MVTPGGLWAAAGAVWDVALLPLLRTLAALGFLLACTLVLFRDALVDGQVYFRSDTVTYYFPIASSIARVLKEGQLLLWTPHIFGGFPLFADGEAGMLYPPNLLAYLLLLEQDAFIWLRAIRFFLGASFTYLYLRSLQLNGFAATIGALCFAFGSFMVMQMHHTNVGNTAIWLPLTLYMVEMAVRSVRRWRWLYATGAGASVGIQALGVHIQPLLMSGLLLAAYIPFRVMLCPIAWPPPGKGQESGPPSIILERLAVAAHLTAARRLVLPLAKSRLARLVARFLRATALWVLRLTVATFHRTVLMLLLLGMIPAIAFGLAAAQVIPLVELGTFSFRGQGVAYDYATSYSMPLQNLINLLFPYFFRYGDQFYWSHWCEWETSMYVGIPPLLLAGVAVLFVRSRIVLFYAAAAMLAVLIALGDYSPYPVYEQLHQLPGFSSLRTPGRFTMLANFSIAVLAAFGVDWLCRTLRYRGGSTPLTRWRRLSRAVGTNGFGLFLLGLSAAIAGVVWWLVSHRMWIDREPWAVKQLVEQDYLSLRSSRPWLTSDMVLSFLSHSLDPTSEKTAIALALMLATFLLLFCWFAFRRLWGLWAALMVGLVAVDLLLFALDFHPKAHISQLSAPDSAIRWLLAENEGSLERIYTAPRVGKTEANRLLPFQVAEITGYSSLQTTRHQNYMTNLGEHDKTLLDIYGVRFVVLPKRFPGLPSYRYTAYHPDRPLANGPAVNRGSQVTLYMNPPVKADRVSFISNLRDANEILQDAEVADIVVVDTSGERVTLKVRAGRDTAEWACERPDVVPHLGHQCAPVAQKIWATDRKGQRFEANLYFGSLNLDRTRTVSRVEYHYTHPQGKVRLYGMMLWQNSGMAHQVLGRDKFVPRYEDDELLILENPSRLPRAFLVPAARVLREPTIDVMVDGDFDPLKVVLLERRDREWSPPMPDQGMADPAVVEEWLKGNPDSPPGSADMVDYGPNQVVIRTDSDRNAVLFLADSYYPGWKATVDGTETRIYRANYLFRAILVPEGQHEVRFVFKPDSFFLGADISTFTASGLLLFWVLLLPGVYLFRSARWAVRRIRTLPPRGPLAPGGDSCEGTASGIMRL